MVDGSGCGSDDKRADQSESIIANQVAHSVKTSSEEEEKDQVLSVVSVRHNARTGTFSQVPILKRYCSQQ